MQVVEPTLEKIEGMARLSSARIVARVGEPTVELGLLRRDLVSLSESLSRL